jgi:tRNA(Ser,Leu) C12 N-acetylase TAN1
MVSVISGIVLVTLAASELDKPEDKYVYARISQNVPYVSMVDNYEFVEREDDVYKLRVKQP